MARIFIRAAVLAWAGLGLVTLAHAQTPSPGAAIAAAISGNTIRGSMVASGTFEEFFAPDGEVRGADYAGSWQIQGDRLCLSYDGDPASCWHVQISGTQLIWIGSGGEEGTGTIIPGNPRGF